ncbi:hypothetical protein GCM10009742_48800 [Kribbella karoonensis]|uniref:Uncharacterized protein n=1 Tax=Kribbella karoonensis TaxID=324851 RepID=A0ABN2E4G0_9ACTN
MTLKVRSAITHRSAESSTGSVADVVLLVDLVADGVALDDGVLLADGVVLRWSDGLLPSDDVSFAPHAAAVRSAAVRPAPRTYVLQLPRP